MTDYYQVGETIRITATIVDEAGAAVNPSAGQSARMITGIQVHDSTRGMTYFDSLDKLVTEYIEKRTPNDWPDAAPEEKQVGGGHTGV